MNSTIRNLIAAATASAGIVGASHAQQPAVKNVVLVHGAFADGSGWRGVYDELTSRGYRVTIVQNPLTSLADDVAATRRALARQDGATILVGHSWGGTVITEAGGNDKVKALVYVAAFAPSAGEASLDGVKGYPSSPGLASPIATPDGFLTLSPETVAKDFAQDVTAEEANLIATTQGAVRGANFEEKVTVAAWTAKPSWYIVADEDRMIQPDAQRALAKKINATTTSLPTSHVPMVSRPKDVAEVIAAAAKSLD